MPRPPVGWVDTDFLVVFFSEKFFFRIIFFFFCFFFFFFFWCHTKKRPFVEATYLTFLGPRFQCNLPTRTIPASSLCWLVLKCIDRTQLTWRLRTSLVLESAYRKIAKLCVFPDQYGKRSHLRNHLSIRYQGYYNKLDCIRIIL